MQTWTLQAAQQLCTQLGKTLPYNETRIIESRIGPIIIITAGLDILATIDRFGPHPAEGCPTEVRTVLQQFAKEL